MRRLARHRLAAVRVMGLIVSIVLGARFLTRFANSKPEPRPPATPLTHAVSEPVRENVPAAPPTDVAVPPPAPVLVEPRLEQVHADAILALRVDQPSVDLRVAPAPVERSTEARGPRLRRPTVALAALRWMVLGLALGLVGALGLAKVTGHETLTVMSGSMEPAIHTGDVVAAKPISPLDARVGDVITFQEPHGKGRLITHRVRRMRADEDKVRFVTKGDANNTVEEWQIASDGKVARVTNRGWKIGYALAFVRDPEKRLFLISIPAVLLGLFELVRIWRPRPSPPVRGSAGEAAA